MSQYWSDIVHKLTPYVPGEQPKLENLVKLNTNENPYGPSPKVIEALKAVANEKLRLYPDPNSLALKAAIAQNFGLKSEQVFVGNGSDEVLAHVFQALLKHSRPLLFPDITYSFYPVYCGLYDIEYQTIPLSENFSINIDDYDEPNGGIILPNPNAPTGIALARASIEQLLRVNNQSVVVIDEAYVDFGAESAVNLIEQYPNLLVVQTLSKARSLAGLRLGFALGSAQLIEALIRVKDSFNSYPIDQFAAAGAIAAIQDSEYFEYTRQKVIATRQKLMVDLQNLGFETLNSGANFIFTQHKKLSGEVITAQLRARNIIVRHFKAPARIASYIRITIGTDEQSALLIQAMQEITQ